MLGNGVVRRYMLSSRKNGDVRRWGRGGLLTSKVRKVDVREWGSKKVYA